MKFLKEENELKRMQNFNRRRNKGQSPFVTYNAGDVEKGMAIFNKNTTLNTDSASTEASGESPSASNGASQGMGESLAEGAIQDIYIDMHEYGKDRYLDNLMRKLRNAQNKYKITTDPKKKMQLENDMSKLRATIDVIMSKPSMSADERKKLEQQLQELQRELVVDRFDAYPWREYQYRKIDKIKQRLKGR